MCKIEIEQSVIFFGLLFIKNTTAVQQHFVKMCAVNTVYLQKIALLTSDTAPHLLGGLGL